MHLKHYGNYGTMDPYGSHQWLILRIECTAFTKHIQALLRFFADWQGTPGMVLKHVPPLNSSLTPTKRIGLLTAKLTATVRMME